MPIYEFYCPDCHRVFNFFSRRINTQKVPGCPKCKRTKLQRQISLFSAGHAGRDMDSEDMPVDEARMEKAMEALAREAQGIDENNPREAARMMRKLADATGMRLGSGMEEAVSRMEAGDDPDQIEREMGDMIDGDEEPFTFADGAAKGPASRQHPPARDDTLYDL